MPNDLQIKYYEELLEKHGEKSHFSLDWKSAESQFLRFQIFEHIFSIAGRGRGFSILDIGCGLGDFYGYLKKRGFRFNYTGYDLSERMVAAAQRKYPEAKFETADILLSHIQQKFDFVFCSGAFNIRFMEEEEHLDKVKAILLRMYELSKVGVGANFLSKGALRETGSGNYHYFNPEDLVKYIRSFCSRFMLRHDYHPADFTLFLLK